MKTNTLSKRATNIAAQKAMLLGGIVSTTIGAVLPVFADDTIFSTMNENNYKVLDEVVSFFNGTVLPWVVLLFFIVLGVCGRNEKVVGASKLAGKVIVVAFIGINLVKPIVNTVIWMAKTIGGLG